MDFLTFKTFISPTLLIVLYYFCAIIIPIFLWTLKDKLINNISFLKKYYPLVTQLIYHELRVKDKIIIQSIMILIFICMEIMLRMMFEFLIAYMQIRDVLVGVTY